MKKALLFLIVVSFILVACGGTGGSEQPLDKRIVGKWTGAMVNKKGDRIPVEWQFIEGGTMVVKFSILNISYGGTWSAEGNRLNFVTEANPEEKNYRDVEWVNADTIKLTKEGITETFSRAKE